MSCDAKVIGGSIGSLLPFLRIKCAEPFGWICPRAHFNGPINIGSTFILRLCRSTICLCTRALKQQTTRPLTQLGTSSRSSFLNPITRVSCWGFPTVFLNSQRASKIFTVEMQPQYRQYAAHAGAPQVPQRAPHTAPNQRRGGIGTPVPSFSSFCREGLPPAFRHESCPSPSPPCCNKLQLADTHSQGPIMPPGHHQQAAINQATIAQHHAPGQALTSELAKRRSRKPTDKTLPDGVEDCITDSEVAQRYKELRDFERRLDATMTRKRLDIVEAVGRNAKVSRLA